MEFLEFEKRGYKIQEKVTNVIQYGDINLKDIINYKEGKGFGIPESKNIESYYDMMEISYIILDKNEDIIFESDDIDELIEKIKNL